MPQYTNLMDRCLSVNEGISVSNILQTQANAVFVVIRALSRLNLVIHRCFSDKESSDRDISETDCTGFLSCKITKVVNTLHCMMY